MSSAIDMSLDDLIKKNKRSNSSKGRGGARTTSSNAPGGPARRNFKRRGNRSAPYSTAKVQASSNLSWAAAASIETGTKLFISNLYYGVSTEDIKDLFSIVGVLKRYNVHYDRSGRSKETADVVFARRVDALAAIKKYNNVQLDGKAMKIEMVGKNISSLVPASVSVNRNTSRGGRRGQRRGQAGHSGRGGRRGGGRGRGEKVSAERLDAELDMYHTEGMLTN